MDSDLQARISDLEDRARRFKLATTGMEGWENYFQNLIMLERDYFFDVMSETLAQFHRDILDEAKAAIDHRHWLGKFAAPGRRKPSTALTILLQKRAVVSSRVRTIPVRAREMIGN
jgi:hypothetical protein